MGIITDVKTELRKADALRINYSTNEKKIKIASDRFFIFILSAREEYK